MPAPGPPRTKTTWNTGGGGGGTAFVDSLLNCDIFFRLLWVNNTAEVVNKKTEKGHTALAAMVE